MKMIDIVTYDKGFELLSIDKIFNKNHEDLKIGEKYKLSKILVTLYIQIVVMPSIDRDRVSDLAIIERQKNYEKNNKNIGCVLVKVWLQYQKEKIEVFQYYWNMLNQLEQYIFDKTVLVKRENDYGLKGEVYESLKTEFYYSIPSVKLWTVPVWDDVARLVDVTENGGDDDLGIVLLSEIINLFFKEDRQNWLIKSRKGVNKNFGLWNTLLNIEDIFCCIERRENLLFNESWEDIEKDISHEYFSNMETDIARLIIYRLFSDDIGEVKKGLEYAQKKLEKVENWIEGINSMEIVIVGKMLITSATPFIKELKHLIEIQNFKILEESNEGYIINLERLKLYEHYVKTMMEEGININNEYEILGLLGKDYDKYMSEALINLNKEVLYFEDVRCKEIKDLSVMMGEAVAVKKASILEDVKLWLKQTMTPLLKVLEMDNYCQHQIEWIPGTNKREYLGVRVNCKKINKPDLKEVLDIMLKHEWVGQEDIMEKEFEIMVSELLMKKDMPILPEFSKQTLKF